MWFCAGIYSKWEFGLHQAGACTKQVLAPSGGLHQAEACTKQGLAPSGGLHQAEACTKQGLAPSRGLTIKFRKLNVWGGFDLPGFQKSCSGIQD